MNIKYILAIPQDWLIHEKKKNRYFILEVKIYYFTPKYARYVENYVFFSIPPPWAGCDTKSIFKVGISGLNLEFSFS